VIAAFSDIEIVSILADATEKTQKPFLKRTLALQQRVMDSDDPVGYIRNILRWQIRQILQISDKIRFDLLFDYLRQILPDEDIFGEPIALMVDLDWHNNVAECRLRRDVCNAWSA
jgi:hypothetical protein